MKKRFVAVLLVFSMIASLSFSASAAEYSLQFEDCDVCGAGRITEIDEYQTPWVATGDSWVCEHGGHLRYTDREESSVCVFTHECDNCGYGYQTSVTYYRTWCNYLNSVA